MEHTSRYNIFVPIGGGRSIVYNSISGFYGILTDDVVHCLERNDTERLKEKEGLWKKLIAEGLVINASVDELAIVENLKLAARYSQDRFHLTINTTLDCNLHCWYCYESHVKNSAISEDTIATILKALNKRYSITPFKRLIINLFGGEPLLRPMALQKIVQGITEFCRTNKIESEYNITTNATLISERVLETFSGLETKFQITLDGFREKHDSVRFFKNSRVGTYDLILSKLRMLVSSLKDYHLLLRLNFDQKTLESAGEILNDLDFLPRDKTTICPHRVWQISDSEIDKDLLFDFINQANNRSFVVDYWSLYGVLPYTCYADLYSQMTVNFDGRIYKCTARDFSEDNTEGELTPDGDIVWDTEKLKKRLAVQQPKRCRECLLYPSCPAFCSQNLLEDSASGCRYGDLNIEEIIILNFNQQMLINKIRPLVHEKK